jgi:hypothetical protein
MRAEPLSGQTRREFLQKRGEKQEREWRRLFRMMKKLKRGCFSVADDRDR